MSPHAQCLALISPSFPRVSGDEPRIYADCEAVNLFSPRERG